MNHNIQHKILIYPNFNVHYSNKIKSIIIINPNTEEIKSLEMLNVLGQTIYTNTSVPNDSYTEFKIENIQTGTYIINIETNKDSIIKGRNCISLYYNNTNSIIK